MVVVVLKEVMGTWARKLRSGFSGFGLGEIEGERGSACVDFSLTQVLGSRI